MEKYSVPFIDHLTHTNTEESKTIFSPKGFIINFDDVCYIPSNTPNTNLAHDSHAPEIFQSNHDESVDIWSVGYLIKTAFVDVQELSDYARTKLMAEEDLDRPTDKEALKWLQ
ncbi:16738_t:CDS:2, partial [Racocetra persica]